MQSQIGTDYDLGLLSSLKDLPQALEDNTFPVDAFTGNIIPSFIKGLEDYAKMPSDFVGTVALTVAATAIGARFEVMKDSNFIESPLLYTALVAPPGAMKSPVYKIVMQPLKERQRKYDKEYELALTEYKQQLDLLKKDKATDKETPAQPIRKRIILSDTTPEARIQTLKDNPLGVCHFSDELLAITKALTRYSNGAGMEDILSGWGREDIRTARKGDEGVTVHNPFYIQTGGIQPSMLKDLFSGGRENNGYVDRLLFAYRPGGYDPNYWNDNELDPALLQNWGFLINRILELPTNYDDYGSINAKVLLLSPAAKRVLTEWQHRTQDEIKSHDSDRLRGYYSKMQTYVLRLSLILQVLRYAENTAGCDLIDEDSALGAVKLAEYYKGTARAILEKANEVDVLGELDLKKITLYRTLPTTFTTAEAKNICKENGYPERSFFQLLKNPQLFIKLEHGKYAKTA